MLSPGIDIQKCDLKKYLIENISKIITELDIFTSIIQEIPKSLLLALMVNHYHLPDVV